MPKQASEPSDDGARGSKWKPVLLGRWRMRSRGVRFVELRPWLWPRAPVAGRGRVRDRRRRLPRACGSDADGSGDSADGLLGTAAVAQALEPGLEVALLLARGGPGARDGGGLEPGGRPSSGSGAALAHALVIPRAQPGPGDRVAGGGRAAHVGADLGEDNLTGYLEQSGHSCPGWSPAGPPRFGKGRGPARPARRSRPPPHDHRGDSIS